MTRSSPTFFRSTLMALENDSGYFGSASATSTANFDFGSGEFRVAIPSLVRSLLSFRAGEANIGYSDPQGDVQLRTLALEELISARVRAGTDVLITAGGKEALWLAVQLLIDEVVDRSPSRPLTALVPAPGWLPYRVWLESLGVRWVSYAPRDLVEDPERVLSASGPNIDLMFLNYPNNPTGVSVSQEGLDLVAESARTLGIGLISDEVYRRYADAADVSLAHAPAYSSDLDIIVESASKRLAAAGLRVGFLIASPPRIQVLTRFRSSYASCVSHACQQMTLGLIEDPRGREWLESLRLLAANNLKRLSVALEILGLEVESSGGIYVWLKYPSRPVQSSPGPVARITDGGVFGSDDNFRVCVARDVADFDLAAASIARAASIDRT